MEHDLFVAGTLIYSIGTIIPKIGAYIKAVGIACIVVCFAIILINMPLDLFLIIGAIFICLLTICMLLPKPKFIDDICDNLKNKIEKDK